MILNFFLQISVTFATIMPKLPVNPSICEMVECKSGDMGVGGGRVVEKRLGAWRKSAMYRLFIFHSQRSNAYRYEVPRATLASIWCT